MKCENFEKGCEWKGKYKDYYQQLEKNCEFNDIGIKCEICE